MRNTQTALDVYTFDFQHLETLAVEYIICNMCTHTHRHTLTHTIAILRHLGYQPQAAYTYCIYYWKRVLSVRRGYCNNGMEYVLKYLAYQRVNARINVHGESARGLRPVALYHNHALFIGAVGGYTNNVYVKVAPSMLASRLQEMHLDLVKLDDCYY